MKKSPQKFRKTKSLKICLSIRKLQKEAVVLLVRLEKQLKKNWVEVQLQKHKTWILQKIKKLVFMKRKKEQQQKKTGKELIIYQAKSGKIEFRGDFKRETIWGNLNQISDLFGRDKSVISRHINNVYTSRELDKNATVAKIATVQKEGKRAIQREIEYYNLDMILSIGYRVDSKQATRFRIWATKTLKQHLLQGYTINKERIAYNYEQFLQAVADVKALLPTDNRVQAKDVLELVNAFASTWFCLYKTKWSVWCYYCYRKTISKYATN